MLIQYNIDTCLRNLSFSYQCLIDEGDTFLITGYGSSRYNSDGWIENIGSLNTGRRSHGCTRYTNNFGAEVINSRMLICRLNHILLSD